MRKNKGITLIALVITIIVLLILAGVSIATLLGENGILNQANKAKEKTYQTSAEESVQVEVLGSYDSQGKINLNTLNSNLLNNLKDVEYNGAKLSLENKIEELPAIVKYNNQLVLIAGDADVSIEASVKPGEEVKSTKKYNYTDGAKFATIPEGFAVSEKEDEQKIDNGLVVKASDGNEFVWIPCTRENYKKAEQYSRKNSTEYKNWTTFAYENDAANRPTHKAKTGWANPEKQISQAEESIEKYGGFYVARYEAGVPSDADFYVEASESSNGKEYKTERNVDILKPVSKKGNAAWNLISQKNAQTVSEAMYEDNPAVSSYLIDSNAWNYICEHIFNQKLGKDITNSTIWGNYSNTTIEYEKIIGLFARHLNNGNTIATTYEYKQIPEDIAPKGDSTNTNRLELATGISEDFKAYNIYDMSGNMWEWTAETTTVKAGVNGETETTSYAVLRGGSFWDEGYRFGASHSHGCHDINYCSSNFGFRPVLYIDV